MDTECLDKLIRTASFFDADEEEDFSLDIHYTHCNHCYITDCRRLDACPTVCCPCCSARMHSCKVDDHNHICDKVVSACPNFSIGCPSFLRRDRFAAHLSVCPASSVVCGRERARPSLSKDAKMRLKLIGKLRKEKEWEQYMSAPERNSDPADISLALLDQTEIIESYTYSRAERVRRRDRINRHEHVLPMREIREEDLSWSGPADFQDVNFDSSDEETKEIAAKNKKKAAMFAQCYMCHVDPGTQHFHTLGRDDTRWEELLKKKERRFNKPIAPFYEREKLMIRLHPDFVPELTVKGDNILLLRNGGTLFVRKCLASVPRSEWGDHVLSQHADGDNRLDCHIVRCPQWEVGCQFRSNRLSPRGGEIVSAFDSSFCHLDELPAWVMEYLSQWLSGVNLAVLSMVSRKMRQALASFVYKRAIVSVAWRKEGPGKWSDAGRYWSFPLTERCPDWVYSPCVALSTHLQNCPFSEPCPPFLNTKEDTRHPVFPPSSLYLINDHISCTVPVIDG